MLAEAITMIIVGAVAVLIGYGGYLGGRDSAERRAYATVSTLRADLTRTRLDLAREQERNRILQAVSP